MVEARRDDAQSCWIRRGAVVLLAVLVAVAGGGPWHPGTDRALAHAVLLRANPGQNARLSTPPKLVDLFFSEPLNHSFSTAQVRDTGGTQRDTKDIHFSGDPTELTVGVQQLQPGFYTVIWTTVSAVDGHRLEGSFPFTLLNPDGTPPSGAPPPAATNSGGSTGVQGFDAALRFLLWLGLMGVTGGFAFALIVLYPAARALSGPDRTRARSFALWLLGAVVPAAAMIVVAINLAAIVRQAELDGSLSAVRTLLQGRQGVYWFVRELFPLAAGLIAWWLARNDERPDGRQVWVLLSAGLTLGLGGLLTMSLTSHAAAGTGTAWAVPSDFLHLSAVSCWLGSLVQLPALLALRRGPTGSARLRWLGTALRRFSTLAVCCVGLVLLTGTFNALIQIPSWSSLTETTYGTTLIVKLVLVGIVLLVGLLNAGRIARRFERAALGGDEPDSGRRSRRLERTAILECVAGAAVIATTAVMVFLVPSKDAVAQTASGKRSASAAPVSSVYRNNAPAGDLQASLTVSPNRVGENDFKVLLAGTDVDKITRVQLRFQPDQAQVGGSTVDATPVPATPGLYDATAANFSFVGRWRVTVNVRRTDNDDVNGAFTVEVPDATGATTSSGMATITRSITAFPAHGITRDQALGALVIAAGALIFVFRRPLGSFNRGIGTAATFAIAGCVVVGSTAIVTGRSTVHTAVQLDNPVASDQRSVAEGKALFAANCAQCHGTTGHGDGPNAAALTPKPLDLTVHVGLHPDSQLFDWITNGIQRTSMPAWKAQLNDTQRWDVINYLRTFSPSAGDVAPPAQEPALASQP